MSPCRFPTDWSRPWHTRPRPRTRPVKRPRPGPSTPSSPGPTRRVATASEVGASHRLRLSCSRSLPSLTTDGIPYRRFLHGWGWDPKSSAASHHFSPPDACPRPGGANNGRNDGIAKRRKRTRAKWAAGSRSVLIVPLKRGNQPEGPRRGKGVPSHEPLKRNLAGTS